jgi:hypothetical protein
VNRGHACWPDDFRSDDASVLLLLIASCDFMTQDQRPWRAPEEEPMTEATSAKPWLATYGDSIPAEIDANATPRLSTCSSRRCGATPIASRSAVSQTRSPMPSPSIDARLTSAYSFADAWRLAGVQAGRIER